MVTQLLPALMRTLKRCVLMYTAQYLVCWTAQGMLYFTPWQTYSFWHELHFAEMHSVSPQLTYFHQCLQPGTNLYSWVNWGIVDETKMPRIQNGSKVDWEFEVLPLSFYAQWCSVVIVIPLFSLPFTFMFVWYENLVFSIETCEDHINLMTTLCVCQETTIEGPHSSPDQPQGNISNQGISPHTLFGNQIIKIQASAF